MVQQIEITLNPKRRGFHLVTSEIVSQLPKLPKTGIVNIFTKHTSCGLSINENLQRIKPTAFPGVIDTLSVLHQKGYTLTIASSRSRNSLTELTRDMGIADYITYMIGADDVKEAKPKPEPVLKTLADLKCEACETLVVGDMAVDILMGVNAGTQTCGVTWGNGSPKELQEAGTDYIIERMEELIEITEE